MRAAANRYSAGWKKSRLQPAAIPASGCRRVLTRRCGSNWAAPRGTTGSVCCYPALCVGSSEARYADTEENALVFGGYQVRFALLDTARSVWQKITD